MAKQLWKPGNMLYPLPAVMLTVADRQGNSNIITVAWTGTVCTNPAMTYISVRPERYSYDMLKETGEFVINLTTKKLAYAVDYCGVKSGRDEMCIRDRVLFPGSARSAPVPRCRYPDSGSVPWHSAAYTPAPPSAPDPPAAPCAADPASLSQC